MAILNNNQIGGASGQGGDYLLESSLRFRKSASAYLNRTPGSAGDRKTWTWSGWVKRGQNGRMVLFDAYASSAGHVIEFSAANAIQFYSWGSGASSVNLLTTAVYRDNSSWYHVVLAVDTTQSTSSDRVKIYINGEQITSFGTATYPALNADLYFNNTVAHSIGRRGSSEYYYDGYMTEVNFIDGQQLTPADFGETNADTGVWQPIEYAGTYGTNGFYLKGRGTDNSGNGNDWTENNFSTSDSTLTTYDIMSDVPTLTDADTSNFATLNPVDISGTLSNGNLTSSVTASVGSKGTAGMSEGKWYWEVTVVSGVNHYLGAAPTALTTQGYVPGNSFAINRLGNIFAAGSSVSKQGLPSYAASDVIGFAIDIDNKKAWWSLNGQWYTADAAAETAIAITVVEAGTNSYDFSALTDSTWTAWGASSSGTSVFDYNFGQRPFAYTPPSGFKKLNTFNLPDSSIVNGREHFNPVLYTGNGSTNAITGVGFQPDLVWGKARSAAYSNRVFDSLRGVTKGLNTNGTNAEFTESGITSFDSDGFSLGSATNTNGSGATFVTWNWKASGTGVSNTDGSITSSVSANTTAGFSIVSYTGTGSATTVGHGLGVAPNMIIVKNRDAADAWQVYHSANTAAPETDYLVLNTTAATADSSTRWNDTAPTSSVFSIGSGVEVNTSSEDYIAYCFADVEGYSKIGTYVGNGSTDGPFVYTGFRPAYVMPKKTSDTSDWIINDTKRDTYNITDNRLFANDSLAESGTYDGIDILSNGFKLRSTNSNNISSQTYIYMAFAENPFKNSLAR